MLKQIAPKQIAPKRKILSRTVPKLMLREAMAQGKVPQEKVSRGGMLQRMLRLTAMVILGGGLLGGGLMVADPGVAQTCTENCGSRQIQFTPGQAVRLQMVNNTASLVQVQQLPLTDTIPLLPGSEVEISSNFGTEPNLSVIFWDETSLAVRAVLFRPEPNVLRIELLPGSGTGDRSVFIENDGRVRLF